jgi:hypothetical protein
MAELVAVRFNNPQVADRVLTESVRLQRAGVEGSLTATPEFTEMRPMLHCPNARMANPAAS